MGRTLINGAKSVSLFGGIFDKRVIKNINENAVTLYINGFCIFGGADIK